MQLFAYNQVGQTDELVIWVGVLGISDPPPVSFSIAGGDAVIPKDTGASFEPLGDGSALNHRAIFVFDWPDTPERFPIEVACGDAKVHLTSKRPPRLLPVLGETSFNLLLLSCYYQPNDKTARNVAWLIRQLKPAADFTFLAGDQVYLDLPLLQDLPKEKTKLAQILGKKYLTNWFSAQLSQPGLANLLTHGPAMCIPDDHEYWNNYPYYQLQLNNTHSTNDRENWRDVATLLYQRYQMAPAQNNGFFRMDIAPLYMLFVDGRSVRDDADDHMFNAASINALTQWTDELLARKAANMSAVGLLSSGQAFLMEKADAWRRRLVDAEMPNYKDFETLKTALTKLINAGIPVIYLTGDVHWGRIVEGRNKTGEVMFCEIIASPARLIDSIGQDQLNFVNNKLRKIFDATKPFPYHTDPPDEVPDMKLANLDFSIKHKQSGDHVAMLRFNQIPGGVSLAVDYYCTDPDTQKRTMYSKTVAPIKIVSLN
ncbi:hypothetical protein [Nitrosomonas aestuarii]|uniref:hypothetical protein n=1 Tax=Nitrosomonas aestuarii TaxID=52441 RepID=UPI000D3010CA|nr:hypothetical protein [Nitrosomonas aestuarii]PTN11988.1 hypothetical protein C8R11_106127 [Nitrosomonas aestuarii]